MKRVFIIHGWEFSPSDNWYPWLKRELEDKGFHVTVPTMPDTKTPRIKQWVNALAAAAGDVDKDTILVGHSIGCQTILRFLSTTNGIPGLVVLVAPWLTLTPEAMPTTTYQQTAKEWLETPINFTTIKTHVVIIYSDNDPYMPADDITLFRTNLIGPALLLDKGKGHFTSEEGVTELPTALATILKHVRP